MSVTIRATNLEAPRTEEELKDQLLQHALECHECLTVVLFQEESLADCGCAAYQQLFQAATDELERHRPIDPAVHVTEELIEAFFLDRLWDHQLAGMAEHVEICQDCRQWVQARQAFYLCVKAAVQEQKSGDREDEGLAGVLGMAVPDAGLHYCARLGE